MVDDDGVFRRSITRMLRRQGYRCDEARAAPEAAALVDAEPDIAAMLCDIRMPGESGLDLLRRVAADHPDLAVVMMSGIDDPQTAGVAFDLGAFGYVVKPFETNELLINLAGALRRRELEMARRSEVVALERALVRTRTLGGVLDGLGAAAGAGASSGEEDLMDRLSRAVSLRDEETGRHMERMSRYAVVLAEAVGFGDVSPDDLRMATALHDVGKIGIPDSVLLKPGPLSADEYTTMQRHAQIGHQLLAGSGRNTALLRTSAGIALAHHEWWNGRGYPKGLVGDEIPTEARIAAVCDVFDALTSDRVYRPAATFDEGVQVLAEKRGSQFEPRLVDAFLASIEEMAAIRDAFPESGADAPRVRVLLVDDQEIFSESLIRLLQTRHTVKVVGAAASVVEAVAAAARYEPHVILMDFELPDGDGAQATERIKAGQPDVKVVMLTARTDEHAFVRAIQAGCSGFVTKHDDIDAVVAAIHRAHDGEVVSTERDLAPFLRRLRPTDRRLGAALSPREIEILGLIASGLSNKQIAERCTLSLNTIRNHVQSVLYKLQAHSKLEAVATGVREGVIRYPRELVAT